jgi:hypothetical protein
VPRLKLSTMLVLQRSGAGVCMATALLLQLARVVFHHRGALLNVALLTAVTRHPPDRLSWDFGG